MWSLTGCSGMALRCIFNAATEQYKSPLRPQVHSIKAFWVSAHILHYTDGSNREGRNE